MPPRVGAGQLWLLLAGLGWALSLLSRQAAPLLGAASAALPGGGGSRAGAAHALLQSRHGRRVVLLRLPRTGGGALCRLAVDNGEAALPSCEPAFGHKGARALRAGRTVEQCTALRAQPLGFVALDEGVPDALWLDAGAIYAATLREPRARIVSELLELQRLGKAHLWGAGKWPPELSALGFNSSGPTPELEALVLAATRREADAHRLPKALRDNAAVRAFAGAAARALPPGRITEAHLYSALRVLDRLDAVLLTEQLQRDVTRLAQLAGWRFWDVTRKDRLSASDRLDAAAAAAAALPADVAEALAAHTALDARLYAAAAARSEAEASGTFSAPPARAPLRRCAALARSGAADPESAAEPLDAHAPWGVGWAALDSALT